MKILLATSSAMPNGGGISSYNQELVNVFGSTNQMYLLTDSDELNVQGYVESISNYGKDIFDYNYCRDIVNRINDASFDVIINSRSSIIPFLSPFISSPIISVSHFVNGIQADNAGYNNKYISKIIALSNFGKEYIQDKFNVKDTHKIEVVYNFIAGNEFVNHFSDKLNNNPLVIVYPGSTSINKSVDVMLDALYLLHKSDLNYRFIWIGGTVLPSANLSLFRFKSIRNLFNNDSRINIIGKVTREESMRILASANIFVLPSRGEGCPMTLLEAMDIGCIPIISDAKHGSLEIIKQCKFGVVVQQDNSNSLFNSIRDIICHHDNYLDHYSGTKSFVKQFLSKDIWIREMNRIINESIDSNKECIDLTLESFNNSLNPYKKLLFYHRIDSILRSLKYRIKLDYIYLKRNYLSF